MKRLILASFILIGALGLANKSNAQVCAGARLSFGFRAPRAYCAPRIAYGATAPYYDEGVVVETPVYGYPYHRHFYGRRFYREPRYRRWRRW